MNNDLIQRGADGAFRLPVSRGSQGNEVFGLFLKQRRESRGLTPAQLADAADVDATFVRGIERGQQAPSAPVAQRLLQALGAASVFKWEGHDLVLDAPDSPLGKMILEFKDKKGQVKRPPRPQSESADQLFARIVRALAGVDEETLESVARLLGLGNRQSTFVEVPYLPTASVFEQHLDRLPSQANED